MNWAELKFRVKEEWTDTKITLKYLVKEPYYEVLKLFKGYYDSALVFWFTVALFIYSWKLGGTSWKTAGILILIAYVIMFQQSGKAKKYYEKEMIKGEEIVK